MSSSNLVSDSVDIALLPMCPAHYFNKYVLMDEA